jgi:hypothetical protein
MGDGVAGVMAVVGGEAGLAEAGVEAVAFEVVEVGSPPS